MLPYYEDKGIKIYLEDNLNVLKERKEESVNLIYSDILYNTGKKFDDYNDNLGTPVEAIKWYRPRIEEMHRVLAANGSIFIHCNWRLDSYMRVLLDEVFGCACYRSCIHRKHSEERGFYANFDAQMDTIFYYVKDQNNYVFNMQEGKEVKLIPVVENGVVFGNSYCFKGKDSKGSLVLFDAKREGKHFLVSLKMLTKMAEEDALVEYEGTLYYKTKIKPIGNLWAEPEMLDRYDRNAKAQAYDTPKPEACLRRIIEIASNPGDTVADFFMGGGTTAKVTKEMGRQGVFCDISKKACDVTIEKLKGVL